MDLLFLNKRYLQTLTDFAEAKPSMDAHTKMSILKIIVLEKKQGK